MEPPDPASEPVTRFDLVNDIVEAAVELPPEQREAFVAEHCERDEALRHSVLRLLSACEKMGDFLCAPPLRAPEIRPGEVLAGRFRVVEKLGEGGMGSVYLAEDRELGEVALKTVRAELRGDGETVERFRSEIRLSRGVGHRNVCPVFELFPNEPTAAGPVTFFTMKYLKGETLAARLARGPIELAEAIRLARGIAAGLDALHAEGIVHRDLKPGNIILMPEQDGRERPVITDFGLARTSTGPDADASKTGAAQILGSPDYMAPEQFLSAAVTKAADIYAFGLIVYEMVSGARPVPKEDMLRAAVRRAREDAPPLRSVAKLAPAGLERGVARALAREVRERPASAGEVVDFAAGDPGVPRLGLPHAFSRRLVLGAAGGATILSCIYGIRRYMSREAPLPESPKLMLTACTHMPGDKDREIAATVDTLLRTQLQQSAHVSLLDSASIERGLARMRAGSSQTKTLDDAKTAREVALREGASYVLFGGLGRKADVYNVGLRLELLGASPERERDHWDFDAQVREDELHAMPSRMDKAVHDLRRKLGESQQDWEVHNRTPAELTTGSWEALQLYVRGNEAWKAEKRSEAIDLIRAATQIDPGFAMAHGRLGDYLTGTGLNDAGMESHQAAVDLVQRRHLSDPESMRVMGMFALDTCQYEKAAAIWKSFRMEYPRNPLPYFFEAGAERWLGHIEYAKALLDRAIELDPGNYSFAMARAIQRLAEGDLKGAEDLSEKVVAPAGDGWVLRLRAAIRVGRFDARSAWGELESMRTKTSPEFRSAAYELQACLKTEQGRLGHAEEILGSGIRFATSNGLAADFVIRHRFLLAEVYRQQNRQEQAIQICKQTLDSVNGRQNVMQTGCVLARSGDIATATKCLVECPDLPVYRHWSLRLRGEISLAKGESKKALALMKSAPPWVVTNVWPEHVARAAVAAGDFALATRELNDLFSAVGRYWFQANRNRPGMLRTALTYLDRHAAIKVSDNIRAVRSMLEINTQE